MKLRFLPRRPALLLALVPALPVFAQTSLPDVVVSANRTEQRVQDALPATTVITRDDIERVQQFDLPSLLARVPGVEIARSGGLGTQTGLFIRGAESRHTLVLVDGVAVNNLNFGLAALEHIALADVERIEIVRGNVSSLYGSAALGGLIQIFTRDGGRGPQASADVQAGSRGFSRASASGSIRTDAGTQLRASLESLNDRGFNAIRQDERPGTNPDRDGYRRTALSLAASQDLPGGHWLGLRLRDARGLTRYDSEFGPASQADESRFSERGAVLEGKLRLGAGLTLDAALTSSTDKLDAAVTAYPYWVDSNTRRAQLGLNWQVAPGRTLTGGIEHSRQSLASDTTYNESARTQDSVRMGYSADVGAHQIQFNVRNDRYSDFGSATTALAGYGYRLGAGWRASASVSTGFNAPTFNDLYYPFGGNAALRPERLRSGELGLQYAAGSESFRVTWFSQRYADLIGYDAFFNRVNIDRARNRGLELSWAGRVADTAVRADLTSQDPVDASSGTRLSRRAATLAHLAFDQDAGPWKWGGALRYSGARADGARQLGAYAVLDATLAYTLSPAWRIDARADNLFDRQYETVYGYRQAGRGLFIGLHWQPRA